MFCSKCGKEIENDTAFCPECGCKIEQQETTAAPQETTAAPQETTAPVAASAPVPQKDIANTMSLIGIIVGAIGIVGGLCIALFGWILGGAGLGLSIYGMFNSKSKTLPIVGISVSSVALLVTLCNSILGAILSVSQYL